MLAVLSKYFPMLIYQSYEFTVTFSNGQMMLHRPKHYKNIQVEGHSLAFNTI